MSGLSLIDPTSLFSLFFLLLSENLFFPSLRLRGQDSDEKRERSTKAVGYLSMLWRQ